MVHILKYKLAIV